LAAPADTAIVDGRRTAQLAQRIDTTVPGLVVVNAADDADRTAIESAADLPVVGVVPRDPVVVDAPVVATDDPDVDEIVSRHGTRMRATRREVIRDQVRDAVEGTGDDRDRDS
jgi:CO dehydrogenase nickel-insertion accessory protein CooC1